MWKLNWQTQEVPAPPLTGNRNGEHQTVLRSHNGAVGKSHENQKRGNLLQNKATNNRPSSIIPNSQVGDRWH